MAAKVPSEQTSGDPRPLKGARRLCRPARGRGGVGGLTIPCPSSPASACPSTRTYTPGPQAAAPPVAAALTSSSFLLLARDTFCSCEASRDQPRALLRSGRCRVAAAAPGTCAWTSVVGAFAARLRPGACLVLCLGRGKGGGECPRLFEVPLLKEKMSNTVAASDLP